MIILRLALLSLWNRRGTVVLTVLGIAVSVALLLGVNTVRNDLRTGFANTISDADLIVGARSGPVNLLLYSVFHLGDATADVSWQTYSKVAAHPQVAWTIPLALGDSHRDFRVLGTTGDYFTHYRYGEGQSLVFAQGHAFEDLFDVVIGADIAARLNYRLGQSIVLSHGLGEVSFLPHSDKPFKIAGILRKTQTPVDRSLMISLNGLEAMHIDWQAGTAPQADQRISAQAARSMDLTPDEISAIFIGLKSKTQALSLQRRINDYQGEPLTAIMPGLALQELWSLMGQAESGLQMIASLAIIAALLGMVAMVFASLNERRREMAILRALGARPAEIAALLVAEAFFISLLGSICGLGLINAALLAAQGWIEASYGLSLTVIWPNAFQSLELLLIICAGTLAGLAPAYRAYHLSLSDGLMIK
jgi:putative ABC transport system permease protein